MYKTSSIVHKGVGIVASKEIKEGTFLGVYFKKDIELIKDCSYVFNGWIETYPLGRYLNHSFSPNLSFEITNCEVQLYTNIAVSRETELTVDYLKLKNLLFIPDSVISKRAVDEFLYKPSFKTLI